MADIRKGWCQIWLAVKAEHNIQRMPSPGPLLTCVVNSGMSGFWGKADQCLILFDPFQTKAVSPYGSTELSNARPRSATAV
jgi:hypothetical protein